ncbi:MAG: DUF3836 domain-containing protein [Phocaeicola sp.]|uniref:DUF3836 domain-containing protein n=1 Tax=Phocaeicola TaxID=909656 RepID=UPI00234F210C|nr:DUF3836 domain-containing protein [Phocaeicola oris]MCE2616927.1 DUF3836 domain-containing protein [Phocaeicola oris]
MLLSIFAAAVMAFNLNTADVKFYHNMEQESDRVSTTTVYEKTGNLLKNKVKTKCTYDEAHRLISKETLRWNAASQKWEYSYRYEFSYSDKGYTILYALWNKKTEQYVPVQKTECENSIIDNALTVTTYRWNNQSNNYEAVGAPTQMRQDYSLYAGIK